MGYFSAFLAKRSKVTKVTKERERYSDSKVQRLVSIRSRDQLQKATDQNKERSLALVDF